MEGCEHIFGLAHQLVKDFTYLDFVHMIPKLSVKVREALLSSRIWRSENMCAASGYHHTYLDSSVNIDIQALSHFPSHTQLNTIATEALEEAEGLIGLLGIVPDSLFHSTSHPRPPIWNWFPEFDDISSDEEDHDGDSIRTKVSSPSPAEFEEGTSKKCELFSGANMALITEDQIRMSVHSFLMSIILF
jgi:hypothetical protein